MEQELIYLHKFFGWWQLTVGLFSFAALFSIWKHISQNQVSQSKDFGLVWLSFAILAWALSGIVEIIYTSYYTIPSNRGLFDGIQSILSMLNSALILLALPCFKHCPNLLNGLIKSDAWRYIVLTTFGLSTLLTLLMILGVIIPSQNSFIYSVDFIYAVFTLIFLGIVLWESFEKRGLKVLAYLSIATIACTLMAQLLKLDNSTFWQIFFSCTFKTILIMLFFALALSWIKELSGGYIPNPKDMYLLLSTERKSASKFEHKVVLTVPPHIQTKQVKLTEKPFQLLKTFVDRKHLDENKSWLEIRPKSRKDKAYDINDYNEINRILDPILNATYGVKNWSADQRNLLKQSIFNYQQNRKIQLRIDPSNITNTES